METSMKTETKIQGRLPAELRASSLVLLKRLGFNAKQHSFEEYEKVGLSPYHYAILALLDELEEKGLVERKRDPDDRRRHLVRMTSDGKRELARLRTLTARLEDEFLSPLDAEQRETLHALLQELAAWHEPRCAPPA